ncbi:MAG: helix-turn-helix domain-containing protein [Kiritimatiellia bacterium]
MSKKRITGPFQVAYGFSGGIQEELEVFQGFQERAREEGWQVLMLHDRFEMQVRNLVKRGGIQALVGDLLSPQWMQSLPPGLWKVHRGAPLGKGVFSVSVDLEQAVARAEAHFREMGYAQFVYFANRRLAGVDWVRSLESLRERLGSGGSTGVFCESDFLARQGIRLAGQLGLRVPEDLGFVGMGDRQLDRLLAEMEISSFPVPCREWGRAAAGLLKRQIEGGTAEQIRLSPGRLIRRKSSQRLQGAFGLQMRVESWIAQRLGDPPPVAEWAKHAGMSRRSFEIAFRRETGMTPYAFLMHLRVEEAKRLLTETDFTVSRIGQELGIPDPPRFSAFFRKAAGMTPTVWRQQAGGTLRTGLSAG